MKIKFPGGKALPCEVTHEETISRELFEETWLRLKRDIVPEYLCTVSVRGHRKVFYMVNAKDCVGDLRKAFALDNKDLLGRPFWATTEEAYNKVYLTHRKALKKAFEALEERCLVG